MPAGRYLRSAILGWIQGDAMPTAPTSVWLHLTTTAPTATVVGTAPGTTGYAPIEIEPADWAAIVEGASVDTLSATGAIEFGPFTEGGTPEEATHAMLMDGDDPGTAEILFWGAFSSPRPMVDAGTVTVGAGDLDVTA